MTIEQIKKDLYKQKPKAHFVYYMKKNMLYATELEGYSESVYFEVPIEDCGDTKFLSHMDAKLLIRYLVAPL